MEVQTFESVVSLATDASVQESINMMIGIGGAIFGKSFITAAGMVTAGLGVTWSVAVTIASEYVARTKTKDTKLYRMAEVIARQTEKAKQKVNGK